MTTKEEGTGRERNRKRAVLYCTEELAVPPADETK